MSRSDPWPCPVAIGCGAIYPDEASMLRHYERQHVYMEGAAPLNEEQAHVEVGDIVRIEWVDSFTVTGWQHYHGHGSHDCTSAGIVLDIDDETIVITQAVMKDDGDNTIACGFLAIPMVSVKSVMSL